MLTAIVLSMLVLVILLLARLPVAFCLAASGVTGLLVLDGVGIAMATLGRAPLQAVSNFTIIVVPLFVAMGIFATQSGLAEDGFAQISRRIGPRFPGGLGIATVVACGAFGAVSGSSIATAATIGRVSISEMVRHGYSRSFAAGVVAAAGTLGIIIPPSIALIFYGIVTGESIGAMLIAGIVPGALSATLYMVAIAILARRATSRTARGYGVDSRQAVSIINETGSAMDSHSASDSKAKPPLSLWQVIIRIGGLFGVVVAGIFTGVMTVTESAAIGALGALILLVWDRRDDPLRRIWERFYVAIQETVNTTAMIFALLVGASLLTAFFVRSRLPRELSEWLLSQPISPLLTVIFLLAILIPLGTVLDGLSMIIITMPLAHPIVTSLGYDGVWFGVLAIKMIELGLITPPVGLNAYVVAGASPDIRPEDVFRGVVPFYAIDVSTIGILFAFPAIITWLPNLMD